MSNAGQAVLAIGGAVVGGLIGGPQGALWGFQAGMLAGSAAFPTDLGTVQGPRLNDLVVQSSTVGLPIPIVYGTYAIAGNLIWTSGIIETKKKKKQGGKGGPTQTVVTYTYKVNCAVGVCEGPIDSIIRIWADTELIYDARPQQPDELDETYNERLVANALFLAASEIYLGTEDQLPDPTIESFIGAGNISAYRGLAYVVFSEFQLANYGNRIPNFRFEVARITCAVDTEYAGQVYPPWGSGIDPRIDGYVYEYQFAQKPFSTDTYTGPVGWTTDEASITTAITGKANRFAFMLGYNQHTNLTRTYGMTGGTQVAIGTTGSSDLVLLYLHYVDHSASVYSASIVGNPCVDMETAGATAEGDERILPFPAAGSGAGNDITDFALVRRTELVFTPPVIAPFDYTLSCWPDNSCFIQQCLDVSVRRTLQPPPQGDGLPWTEDTVRTWKRLASLGIFGVSPTDYVTQYPLDPALPDDHPDYSNAAFWQAAYAAAVAAGDIPSGLTYGVDYPVTEAVGYYRESTACSSEGIALGEIVRDICLRCGLSAEQIDVSDLTELVDGYVVSRVMSGRDAISPLRSYGWFDCVESDGQLKWPTRGKAVVATLEADDLAAHVAGDERPPAVEIQRAQEVDLPRRLRVHYAQTLKNYEPGEQGASRLAAGDIEVRDLEVAVAMSDTKAAQIAEVVLYDSWVSRNGYRLVVDQSWLALEPGDAITAPIDGRQERLRIVSIDHALPGLLALDCVRDDDGVYVSYAIGAPAAYSTTLTSTDGPMTTVGTAELVLMDLPLLRDSDNDAGYYGAIRAVGGNSFSGAVLYRSPDGGTTYDEVATTDQEATVGRVIFALDEGPTTIVDEGNELYVDLDSGDLESITEAGLLAGLNAAAIGADGRWEIIQFRDAVISGSPNSWRLTGLLRGRRGTEWAVGLSQADDKFVLLDGSIMRVPLNISGIGAERQHKAVLVGGTLEAATAVPFTAEGVALEPFAPVQLSVTRESDNDLAISWVRRGRIGEELPSGADIPLSEESEAYEIDIVHAGDVVRTISTSLTSVTYTAAQQAADVGSPVPTAMTVRVYQLSAVVGRGYSAEATIA